MKDWLQIRLHSFRRKGGWLCWWGQKCNIAFIESVVNAKTAARILVEELQALQLVQSIVCLDVFSGSLVLEKNRFWDLAVATVALAMVHTRYPLVLEDAGMIEPHVEPTQEVHESSSPGQLESFADSIFKFFNTTWHSRDLFLFSDWFAALSIDTINPISDIMFCNVLHQSGDKQLTIYIYAQRCLSCPFWC